MPTGTITRLQAQEHDAQRVNVFIDDTFALGISLDTLAQADLFVGKMIDSTQWKRLVAAEQSGRAFQLAVRYLQARPRSQAEVRDRLKRAEIAPELIKQTLERLQELDLLNDRAFAEAWVNYRNTTGPRGQKMLRSELLQKGVDRATVAEVLDDEELLGDEAARALELARGRLRSYANVADWATFQRRLGGYLLRRGFDYATVRSVVAQVWDER